MPTGGGKTSVAASMMKRYSSELKSAIFVVHRREIVHQASERLRQEGVAHGIIMAGEKDRSLDRIQVCSNPDPARKKFEADGRPDLHR